MSFKEGKLDSLIRSGEYDSAIVSTYTLDSHYLSVIFTSLIRSKRIKNLIILCDTGEFHKACGNPESFELLQNSKIVVLPADTNRLFHPKIIFLIGPKAVCSIIGSGNLTYSGMGGNDEIWGAFHVTEGRWENANLVKDCWKFLSSFLPHLTGLGKQLTTDWILNHSTCFKKILEDDSPSAINQSYKLLTNENSDVIWDSIVQQIGGESIQDVTIFSPYYDSAGLVISKIKETLKPVKFNVIYDENGLLPKKSDQLRGIQFHSWQSIKGHTATLHAKIFSISLASGRRVNVLGSANATPSGLGLKGRNSNVEAVVLFESKGKSFYDLFGYDLAQYEPIAIDSLPESKEIISEPKVNPKAWDQPCIIYAEINGPLLSFCFNKQMNHPVCIDIATEKGEIFVETVTTSNSHFAEIDMTAILADKPSLVNRLKVHDQSFWTVIHSVRDLRRGNPDQKYEKFDQALAAIDANDFDFLFKNLTESLIDEKAQIKSKYSNIVSSIEVEGLEENLNLTKEDFIERKSKTKELHELQSEFYMTSIYKLIEKYVPTKSKKPHDLDVSNESLNLNSEEEIEVDDELAERPEMLISIVTKSSIKKQRRTFSKFFNRVLKYFEQIHSITSLNEFKDEVVQKRVVSYWLLILHIAFVRIKEELIEKIEDDEIIDFTISPKIKGASISLVNFNSVMIPKVVGYFLKYKIGVNQVFSNEQKLDSLSVILLLLILQHYDKTQKIVLSKRIQNVLRLFDVNGNEKPELKEKLFHYKQSLFPNDTSLQNDWLFQNNIMNNFPVLDQHLTK